MYQPAAEGAKRGVGQSFPPCVDLIRTCMVGIKVYCIPTVSNSFSAIN